MDVNLHYEAWINRWSYAWSVHKTGKGQVCALDTLLLEPPAITVVSPNLIQRLAVENSSFLSACMLQDPFTLPCKKATCSKQVAPSGFCEFWADLVLKAFAHPMVVSFVIQSREEWINLLNLITTALGKSSALQTIEENTALVASCCQTLEYTLYRPSQFDCAPLLAALGSRVAAVPEEVISKFAAFAVSLGTEATMTSWFQNALDPRLASYCALSIFEAWRAAGVTGSAAAEKLLAFLGATPLEPCTFLETLRRVVQAGNAACLAHNQSVVKYLRHIAENQTNFVCCYNASLLLAELFPRQAWDAISLLLPKLHSAAQVLPFIHTAFALNDVQKLLDMLPETYEVLLQDSQCLNLAAAKSRENTQTQNQTLIDYAEAVLREGRNVSLSWIGLMLAVAVGGARMFSSDALKCISLLMRGQRQVLTASIICYWCAVIARHYNANLRDCEIELTITQPGRAIEYLPKADDSLAALCLECCGEWLETAPRVITALQDRLSCRTSDRVFKKVEMRSSPINRRIAGTNAERIPKQIDSIEDLKAFLNEMQALQDVEITPWNDGALICHDYMNRLYHGWHHLVTAEGDDVALFEKHVEAVVGASRAVLDRLSSVLCHWGQVCAVGVNGACIYGSEEKASQLQRFLEVCLGVVSKCIARPLKARACFLNNLWFDLQFTPQLEPLSYIVKASGWFYNDPATPLPLKLSLALIYANFLEFVPKNFKQARLPLQPLEAVCRGIKLQHKKLREQLRSYDLVAEDARSEDFEYQREIAEYIVSALGE